MFSQTIDGYTIRVSRVPSKDTGAHRYYRYTLMMPDGRALFGKACDTVGVPTRWHYSSEDEIAALASFDAATLQPGGTDAEYFETYTPEELEWCRSYECEALACSVSDRLESAGLL